MDFTVSAKTAQSCPLQVTRPAHYIGKYATPCRCTEYEAMIARAKAPSHLPLHELGLRPRTLHALSRGKLHTTQDVVAMPLEQIECLHGINHIGVAAVVYLMAMRGIRHPDVVPAEAIGSRADLQSVWETYLASLWS